MRESLKDEQLSFTEIAQAVGQRWQALPIAEREQYEQQAALNKEQHIKDMAEYRKTENWARYNEYLIDFKRSAGRQGLSVSGHSWN